MTTDDPRFRTTVESRGAPVGDAPAAGAHLRVVHPRELRQILPLRPDTTILGRNPDSAETPALLEDQVSRRHVAIEWDGAGRRHVGVDLRSRNGSFIDGVRADERRPLGDGSVIRLGGVVAVYELTPEPPPAGAREVSREAL